MNAVKRTHLLAVVVAIASVCLLSGCAVERDRSDKPSEDWSRGLLLGSTDVRQPVALQVDADKRAHLVWRETTAEGKEALRYVRLDQRAQVQINDFLGIDLPNPGKPQLLVDGGGGLHLAWLSRAEGRRALYHVEIDADGRLTEPLLLSRAGENVDRFQMYLSSDERVTFVWVGQVEQGPGGVYYATLGPHSGGAASAPVLLIPEGIDPSVVVDPAGTTHIAWLYERAPTARDVYYATLEGSRLVPDGGFKLTDFQFGESALYYGPIVGLDTNTVYVLWAVQNTGGGFTPTAARAFYVSFEPGKPSLTNPRSLALPNASRPEYADYLGAYGYRRLVPLSSQVYGGDFNNAPATVSSQRSELPVVFSLMVVPRGRTTQKSDHPAMAFEDPMDITSSEMQLAMLVLADGEPVGYQLASDTASASVLSVLVADEDANLHLAWIDTAGFRRYDVYYASNALEAKSWLDRTTVADVVLDAADLMWGIISGIGLLPIALIWNLLPVIWVFLFYVATGQESLDRTGARVGLVVAILVYVASKLVLLPGLSAGLPFLYRLPRGLASIAAVGVPVLVFLLAVGAIVLYVRRADRAILFKAYLIFAATDGLLTIVLYAPGFFDLG